MSILDIFKKNRFEEEKEQYERKIENMKRENDDLIDDIKFKSTAIEDLKNEIQQLKETLAKLEKKEEKSEEQNHKSIKQDEVFHKNLKEARDKIELLEKFIKRYNLNMTTEDYYYRIEIERFFRKTKFKDLIDYLKVQDIIYLDEVNLDNLDDIKNIDEARRELEKFNTREFIEWDIITYMNKGDKVTKPYQKSRKILNIFATDGIEFMEDLKDYDFSKLLIMNFKPASIKKLQAIRDEYYNERRIVK